MAAFYTFRNGQVAEIREIIDSFDVVQQVLEREIAVLIVAANWTGSRRRGQADGRSGTAVGGIAGALLFGMIAFRDAEIAIEREPARRTGPCRITGFYCKSHTLRSIVHCKIVICIFADRTYLFVY